jgi:hypothetical protein
VDYDGKPCIVRSGQIYGAGPVLTDKELSHELGIKVVTDHIGGYHTLTCFIYDDFSRSCHSGYACDKDEEVLRAAFYYYNQDPAAEKCRCARKEMAQILFNEDRKARIEKFQHDRGRDSLLRKKREVSYAKNIEWHQRVRPDGYYFYNFI